MFAIKKSLAENIEEDQAIKVSFLIEDHAVLERRKTRDERRLPVERRKTFSSLYRGHNKRQTKLGQRRKAISRRDIDQGSFTIDEDINKLALNAVSINNLINDQMRIVKKISQILPFKKGLKFSQLENGIQDIYTEIKLLMQKEEYLLCLYLEANNSKLTIVHIDKLLSIINTDISKLSDEVMQFVDKYYTSTVNDKNIGFIQLDMNAIRKKLIICLYKKKKHLYPIYIIN